MVASRPPFSLLFDLLNDESLLYADNLQKEGERALLQGDEMGADLLEEAAKMAPSSPELFCRQGEALFEFGALHSSVPALRKAAAKFYHATSLNPGLCKAWHTWAHALAFISSLTGQTGALLEAKVKIEQAAALANTETASEIYWDAALIYQNLAERSGETDDLFKAVAYFEKSAASGEKMLDEFWTSFGKVYATYSERIDDVRYVFKSIGCFKQALALSLSSYEGWMGLGKSLRKLYQFSHESEHYHQACDCFAAASQLDPQASEAWMERIEFSIEVARQLHDTGKLRSVIEKCEKAALLFAPPLKEVDLADLKTLADLALRSQTSKPSSAYISLQAYWAEALALLGAWTHRIELVQDAERKINQAIEMDTEDNPFLINQHGKCLMSFAEYFHDLDLYYQAIEEFQSSISIDRTQLTCWIWMGRAFAKVYECADDLQALENSIYFYSKALQIKAEPQCYYEIAALQIQLGLANRTAAPIAEARTYLEYLLQNYKSTAFDHPEWFFQYGLALDILGDLDDDASLHHKALEAFVNVLMFSPSYPKIHHRIGVAYCHLGDALGETDYFFRSLHHFKLAAKSQIEDETLLIDWGLTWMQLARQSSDGTIEQNSFMEAEYKLIQAAQLGSELVFYHLACLYALWGSVELSVSYLYKSFQSKTLPPVEEVLDDDWLEGVKFSPQFQEFLALLPKN